MNYFLLKLTSDKNNNACRPKKQSLWKIDQFFIDQDLQVERKQIKTRKSWESFLSGKIIAKNSPAVELTFTDLYDDQFGRLLFIDENEANLFLAIWSETKEILSGKAAPRKTKLFARELVKYAYYLNDHFTALTATKNRVKNQPAKPQTDNILLKLLSNKIQTREQMIRARVNYLEKNYGLSENGEILQKQEFLDDLNINYKGERLENIKIKTHYLFIEIIFLNALITPYSEKGEAIGWVSQTDNIASNKLIQPNNNGEWQDKQTSLPLFFFTTHQANKSDYMITFEHELKHVIDYLCSNTTTEYSAHYYTNMVSTWAERREAQEMSISIEPINMSEGIEKLKLENPLIYETIKNKHLESMSLNLVRDQQIDMLMTLGLENEIISYLLILFPYAGEIIYKALRP